LKLVSKPVGRNEIIPELNVEYRACKWYFYKNQTSKRLATCK